MGWLRRLSIGSLHSVAAIFVVLGMSVAADYGIGPVHAAVTTTIANAVDKPPSEPVVDSKDSDPGAGFVRLEGHVPAALNAATLIPGASPRADLMVLNLVLKRDDQSGFDRYLHDVYDAASPHYRHFRSQKQLTKRYGPSAQDYAEVSTYLKAQGLQVVNTSKNRLTLTAQGSAAAVERALRIEFQGYRLGEHSFYASATNPALPVGVASHVVSIDGLSQLTTPSAAFTLTPYVCGNNLGCQARGYALAAFAGDIACIAELFTLAGVANVGGVAAGGSVAVVGAFWNAFCPFLNISNDWNNVGFAGGAGASLRSPATISNFGTTHAAASRPAVALSGAGQKIGLLEYDGFYMSDVSAYLTLLGSPSSLNNVAVVPVNGGVASPGSGETEVLMDIDTVLSLAPGAKVSVYEAPFNGQAASYSTLFNAMINDGVTIISNSWASCEDQVSQAEATGIDSVLQSAAASGISVFNGSGDAGSTCLDGSPNTISVPADSPSATAVGGTSFPNGYGQGGIYNGETWWNGSTETPATGQGGFGVSRYFPRPNYQSGLNANAMRSIPDVAIQADPAYGILLCQQDNGGCPTPFISGGTSLAAPEWAAVAAAINQVQGKNIGAFNSVLYPLASTDGFHSAASMNTDFYHVGLGSPNVNAINRLLKGQTVGVPVAANSILSPVPPAAIVPVHSDGTFTVPADGQAAGGVLVTLVDANGNIVAGKTITLTASAGSAAITPASGVSTTADGAVLFTVTDLAAETVTYTATDTTDGVVIGTLSQTFGPPAAASAGITVNPALVAADGSSSATIIVTLKDSLNRPSPGKTVMISDAGAHAVITGPTPSVTDANGQIQFLATDLVDETVTFSAVDVTDDNLPIPGSGSVTYSGSTGASCGQGTPPVAASGFVVTPFVTGVPAIAQHYADDATIGCPGADNPLFTPAGTALVADSYTGMVYQVGATGGAASTANVFSNISKPSLGPLVFGKDGNLYATAGNQTGLVVQVDPTTGAQVRVVASGFACPAGLAVDPLSGDLFLDGECNGSLSDASLWRIVDPASANPSVVVYATLPSATNGGIVFAPNGTMYVVSGYVSGPTIQQVSGTNSSTVTVTTVSGITSTYSLAIGAVNSDGSAQSLIVDSASGAMSEVPLANPSNATAIISANTGGAGVIGPDGCLYSPGYDTVYKITNSAGGCSFASTSVTPTLTLTPGAVSPNPAQGSSQTFTATLKNVAAPSGVAVTFLVGGVNSQTKLVDAVSSGSATMTYTAAAAGSDTVAATATVNGTTLVSNTVPVTWTAGKNVTFLSMNTSPQNATIGQPVSVAASLTDVSVNPVVGIAGQSVTLSVGSATCSATTNSGGVATCSLTPSQAGSGTLTATFGGSSTLAASTRSVDLHVSYGPSPAPTVTIAVSPTTIATGSSATLTWSTTNATACTASGAWTGNEAISGTQAVTPASTGSYSYTLTCSGNGGTAAATAVLSATLVAVTVSAKSGGGAVTWPLLLLLVLLVAMRCRRAWPLAGPAALGSIVLAVLMVGSGSARADQSLVGTSGSQWSDPLYVGIRVGSMPVRLDSGKIDQGLASLGYGEVSATVDTSGTAGTVFVGYEFMPYAGLELAYTYRNANAAQLHGNIASVADLTPLLHDTTEMLRDYGNIVSLSYSGHFDVAPRFTIEPRLGGFFWATKDTAVSVDDRIDQTHEGGGVTVGVTGAYRVWRGLELGLAIDHFRGFPNNIATFYGGTLEWRFGRP